MAHYLADWPDAVKDNWPMEACADVRFIGRMAKTLRDELIDHLDRTGMSLAEFQRRSGVSYDVLNKLKRRPGSSTSAENAEKIRAAFDSGSQFGFADSLMDGPTFRSDPEALTRVEPGDAPPASSQLVPVYDVQASAGHGAMADSEVEAYSLAFPPAYLKKLTSSAPGNLAIVSVKGESMEPTLLDDDIVLLDGSKTNLSYDGLFVLRFDDALHVKRIGRSAKRGHITIISDNKDLYPPLEAAVSDVEPVGKVLWYGRKV